MTKRYLTIDGGTTNTRVSLVENERIVTTRKIDRGAKAGIDDREGLKIALRDTVREILEEASLTESDICRVLASGMITSEFGLIELPHVSAPAGIGMLHDTIADVEIPEVTSIPFSFIRGVKVDSEILDKFDMMRGEETELCGLMAALGKEYGDGCVYVLPGSHSKIVSVDSHGRIADFSTMLTGEMIASLSKGTILKDAVDLSISEFDTAYLNEGYEYAHSVGLNKALFKTRILKNRFKKSPTEVYSFFLGAVLADEIDYILSTDTPKVAIGGKKQIKEAMAHLLRTHSEMQVAVIPGSAVDSSTALGAIRIYEYQF